MTATAALSWLDNILIWPVGLPLLAGLGTFLLPRHAKWIGPGAALLIAVAVALTILELAVAGEATRYSIGGWGTPLGIDLYVDGLTGAMLLTTTLVGVATSFYAAGYFSGGNGSAADHQGTGTHSIDHPLRVGRYYWPLWLFLWASLNALILSHDAFNLYVTLELMSLTAVALAAGSNTLEALQAALRYLLIGMLASLSYLLGIALLYASYGVLDITLLAERIDARPATWAAIALISSALMVKTALFPFHFWLPPAHANAPSPVSAVLSGLVIKASFYILLRFWFELYVPFAPPALAVVIGTLGAIAIVWGSLQAVRQARLKLLVAYSTVAQLGYLFLVFPLAGGGEAAFAAWSGIAYFIIGHACAKAAMFLCVGTIMEHFGHDRISGLRGVARTLPLSVFTFALAGVSLMGLPPSGGFVAKWSLLMASLMQGQWVWTAVIMGGSLLAAFYVFRFLGTAIADTADAAESVEARYRRMTWPAFILGLIAFLIGLGEPYLFDLLHIGAMSITGVDQS